MMEEDGFVALPAASASGTSTPPSHFAMFNRRAAASSSSGAAASASSLSGAGSLNGAGSSSGAASKVLVMEAQQAYDPLFWQALPLPANQERCRLELVGGDGCIGHLTTSSQTQKNGKVNGYICNICIDAPWLAHVSRGLKHLSTSPDPSHARARTVAELFDEFMAMAHADAETERAARAASARIGTSNGKLVIQRTMSLLEQAKHGKRVLAHICALQCFENPSTPFDPAGMEKLVHAVFELARATTVAPHLVFPARTMVTANVDALGKASWERVLSMLMELAVRTGLTVGEDGKTSNGECISAITLDWRASHNFVLDLRSSGSQAKTALALATNIIAAIAPCANLVYSFAGDGAAVVVKAGRILVAEEAIIWSRCQCHALALLIKRICGLEFIADIYQRALSIITHFNSVNKLKSWLKELGGILHMLIDTRFNFVATSFSDLLANRTKLISLVTSPEYDDMGQGLGAEKRQRHKAVSALIVDPALWKGVDFVQMVAWEVTKSLRLMDAARPMAAWARMIWDVLARKVAGVLMLSKFAEIPLPVKVDILEKVVSTYASEVPICLDAAYLLNSHALSDIKALRLRTDTQSQDEYTALLISLESCVETVVRRRELIEHRAQSSPETAAQFPSEQQKAAICEKKDVIMRQYSSYIEGLPPFNRLRALAADKDDPDRLWYDFIAVEDARELASVALVVLNIACTTSTIERGHKLMGRLFSKTRNRMLRPRLVALMRSVQETRASAADYVVRTFTYNEYLENAKFDLLAITPAQVIEQARLAQLCDEMTIAMEALSVGAEVIVSATCDVTGAVTEQVVAAAVQAAALEAAIPSAASAGSSAAGGAPTDLAEPERRTRSGRVVRPTRAAREAAATLIRVQDLDEYLEAHS